MTAYFKVLLRDPALIIDLFESGVVLAVALGLFNLSGESQRDLIALFITVLALAKGVLTKPFTVTALPDLGRAALVFFGSVQLTHLTADQITLVATFLGTITTVMSRAQITPTYSPVADLTGSGAGPVLGEGGFMDAGVAGLVALLAGALIVAPVSSWMISIVLAVAVLLGAVQVRKTRGMRLRR